MIFGGRGADVYVYSRGHDRVYGFERRQGDKVDMRHVDWADSFEDLEPYLTVDLEQAMIKYGEDEFVLYGAVRRLDADDFLF